VSLSRHLRGNPRRRRANIDPPAFAEHSLLLLIALILAGGGADPDRAALHLARALALATLPTILFVRSITSPSLAARRGLRTPLWVPSIIVLAGVLVQATGGAAGILSPVAFLAVGAASLGPGSRRVLPWALLLIVALLAPSWAGWTASIPIAKEILFAMGVLLCSVVPGRRIDQEREKHERTRARLQELDDEAGGFRGETHSALPALRQQSYDHDDRDRELQAAARELKADIAQACDLLLSTTSARAAVVYRPDGEQDSGRLVAVATAGDDRTVIEEVEARAGLFGAAFKVGTPVCLLSPNLYDRRIVHRSDTSGIGAVLALPLVDKDRPSGVIVLDFDEEEAVTPACREQAGNVAGFLARLIAQAVDLAALREGMRENHALYEACREVSRHVHLADIAEAVVDSASAFVHLDACALALCDSTNENMAVVATRGFDSLPHGTTFSIESRQGLLAQAVRHGTTIDRPDLVHAHHPPVLFGQEVGSISGLTCLLVVPVWAPGAGDSPPIGALVVARRQGLNFDEEDEDRLEVLLHQVGAAMSNGQLFAEHKTRGITDPMTGLSNHGQFQEVLASKIASSERTGLRLSLLLIDIDHFKSINDTHGHPMGDDVIKRLAGLLEGVGRTGTDLAARYGGEEFCLVLDDTDAAGAAVVADRLRDSFRDQVFVHNDGQRPVTFQCSMSIGIACYPDDADHQAQLIERADQALYLSKQSGRDATTCYQALRASA